jgi:hypothetical protein
VRRTAAHRAGHVAIEDYDSAEHATGRSSRCCWWDSPRRSLERCRWERPAFHSATRWLRFSAKHRAIPRHSAWSNRSDCHGR